MSEAASNMPDTLWSRSAETTLRRGPYWIAMT